MLCVHTLQAFCREHFLHQRHLQEASELHKQLKRVLQSPAAVTLFVSDEKSESGKGEDYAQRLTQALKAAARDVGVCVGGIGGGKDSNGLKPGLGGKAAPSAAWLPPRAALDVLRRAVAVGWADCVARRARTADQVAAQHARAAASGGKRHAIRYLTCHTNTATATPSHTNHLSSYGHDDDSNLNGQAVEDSNAVYLHPRSALHTAAPEYVTYTQIVRAGKRPYMAATTAIQVRRYACVCVCVCACMSSVCVPIHA